MRYIETIERCEIWSKRALGDRDVLVATVGGTNSAKDFITNDKNLYVKKFKKDITRDTDDTDGWERSYE